MIPRTVAIDGSAASGKSTLGSSLAQRLNYLYLDTGVMYRAVTWAALHLGIDVTDENAVSDLAQTFNLEIIPPTNSDGRQSTILVNGIDVTWLIHSPEVNKDVSLVSSYPEVRRVLTQRQRQIAQQGPVVMVGRDIGTVVLPNADLKLFTVASAEVRARRRYDEYRERGIEIDFDHLLADIIRRDKFDAEKPISPMVPAADAIVIDTDTLSKDAVLNAVEALIRKQAMP